MHSTKFVVDYFRCTPDHRLLFGGGETYSDRPPRDLAGFVRRYMLRVFPQLADVRIDHAWSGRLAITRSRLPHVGRIAPNGFFAHGFSGHGVALTQIAGKLVAETVAGTAERFDVLAGLKHRPWPGGGGSAIRCSSSECCTTPSATGSEPKRRPGARGYAYAAAEVCEAGAIVSRQSSASVSTG